MINLRSQDIANLDNIEFHIVGCGAIGSSVAIQLTRLGGNNFHLYDFDDDDLGEKINLNFEKKIWEQCMALPYQLEIKEYHSYYLQSLT